MILTILWAVFLVAAIVGFGKAEEIRRWKKDSLGMLSLRDMRYKVMCFQIMFYTFATLSALISIVCGLIRLDMLSL